MFLNLKIFDTALLCAVFFFTKLIFSQSGTIIYENNASIRQHFQELKNNEPLKYKRFESLAEYERKIKSEIKYKLIFNKKSLFKPIEQKKTDDAIKIAIDSEGIFVKENNSNFYYLKRNFKTYEVELMSVNWELTNESKLILGYECLKATGYKIDINGKPITNHKIVAWYSKKLKYPYGPLGFGDLPGVILQLDYKSYHLKAISISNEKVLINEIPKGERITELELYDLLKK